MNFQPTYDRLLVDPIEEEERTLAGLVLVNNQPLKMCQGIVVAIGKGHLMPDYKFRPCEHETGDKILYYKHDACPVRLEGKEYHILKDNQPFGIIKEVTH